MMRVWQWLPVLGLICLAGCADGHFQKTFQTGQYFITLYSFSHHHLQPGNNDLGLRLQDRDYRILDCGSGLQLTVQAGAWQQTTSLQSGPGRDYRGQVVFPGPGLYNLVIRLPGLEGQEIRLDGKVKVSAGHTRATGTHTILLKNHGG